MEERRPRGLHGGRKGQELREGTGILGRHHQGGTWERRDPGGTGRKLGRGGATEGWPGAGGRERHGDGALGALGAAAWDHSGGQNGAEQPGRTRREGKILEKRGGLGLGKQKQPSPIKTPSLSILPVPSAPPTSCATLRSWCCLGTLWASPRLP